MADTQEKPDMDGGFTEVRQSYVVRVYRRSKADPRKLDGIVEFVEEAKAVRFHDLKTLCDAFAAGGIQSGGQLP